MECDVDFWLGLLDRVGFTLMFIVVVIIGLWRTARWLAPKAETWVSRWLDTMEAKSELLEQQSKMCLELQQRHIALGERLLEAIQRMEHTLDMH